MKAWRWAAATFAAGMSANVVKLGVARVRPHAVAEKMGTDLGSFASAADTFGPFFPPLGASSAWQSFPSGHAATAAGLAIALSWLYPHARWAFFALAALACFQRLASHAHYLSDVCWGAGLGTVVALGVLAGARKRRQHALPLPIAGAIESSRVDASRSLSRFGRRAS